MSLWNCLDFAAKTENENALEYFFLMAMNLWLRYKLILTQKKPVEFD